MRGTPLGSEKGLGEQGVVEGVQGGEVLVERRPAHAHAAGDLGDAQRSDAVLAHDRDRVLERLRDDPGATAFDAGRFA
jgi:hypothetical protein